MEHWLQNYDPLGNAFLSTTVAALPVVVLLSAIAIFRIRIHFSALLGLGVALAVALFVYHMPAKAAAATTIYGAAYGLFPIGWIILNLIFLYQLTVKKGWFEVLRNSLGWFAPDPRVQVILIAFSFGAFFEGAAGFGTPVAVTAAILIQLGFNPLQASGLSLIANTAPVAYGALGTPIIALSTVTGLDLQKLSAMVGRQLPLFSLIVPFWVVWAFAGFRGMLGVWPAALVAGVAFAIPQFLVSNFHGPWLVDIVAAISSMIAVAVLLKFWQPKDNRDTGGPAVAPSRNSVHTQSQVIRAWVPWVLLSLLVFLWGVPQMKDFLNGDYRIKTIAGEIVTHEGSTKISFPIAALHSVVVRTPPVVASPTPEKPTRPEEAVFTFNWLSATGSGILVSAIIAGFIMGFGAKEIVQTYWETLVRVRFSLITIAAMLALGYVTRYSGSDATLGLALAKTGALYPFFGTLLGWLGVALTGSDTASNVLFGSLQKITAEQTGLSPVLMAAANSSGGVMGKMVDAQSIVVASTATNWYGHEDKILR
ncbi:MAG: lactate permease, partial [Verrucomicrobia bacterium]